MSTSDQIISRIDELLTERDQEEWSDDPGENVMLEYSDAVAAYHGALHLATMLYGSDSHHARSLLQAVEKAKLSSDSRSYNFRMEIWPIARGCLQAMRGDVKFGLLDRIERRALGEVLGDLLNLAKQAINERTSGSQNVAAVLTAAAYEDTLRRLATSLTPPVTERIDLSQIISALKTGGVLTGASLSTGQGFLKFRNDA